MLPMNRPLTDHDIITFTKKIKLKNFRGVFMRDKLPKKSRAIECGIINLDNNDGPGTHWVTYYKNKSTTTYYDSFGNLQPPRELVKYIGSNSKIIYNHKQYQTYKTFNCGHLCLEFLYNFSNKME